jgi:intein-encoded DNA endonuclease-like protein
MPIFKKKHNNFFKEWTPAMAYVLGFFAADGCMSKNKRGGHFIEFQITDGDLLEKIRDAMGSQHVISLRPGKNNEQLRYRLQIGSKELFSDLLGLGMTPRKSLTLQMPPVPDEYLAYFVRGYFDGDGNVYANEYQRSGRRTPSMTLLTGFTCGSKGFLEALHGRLHEGGIVSGGSIFRRSGYFRLYYSVRDSCKLYRFMYNTESDLFLARKKAIFERHFSRKGISIDSV